MINVKFSNLLLQGKEVSCDRPEFYQKTNSLTEIALRQSVWRNEDYVEK